MNNYKCERCELVPCACNGGRPNPPPNPKYELLPEDRPLFYRSVPREIVDPYRYRGRKA